ncbi:MAG TPA: L-rhamnose mutarotase [Actinomycetota bacterium]|nr:L-rhamnose mutarotase [Actinomycetota bacterium]
MSRRHCFLLRAHPDRMDEYRRRHERVWPEMLRALADTGWRNYSLFLHDDGLLVGYVEADDLQASLAAMARTDVNRRWQAEMAPFFVGLEGGGPDEGLVLLEEVFHLEDQLGNRPTKA